MTREETKKIVQVLSIAFPTFLRDKSNSEKSEVIDLWAYMFIDYGYMEVNAALKTFIATSKYPPTIAEVLSKLRLVESLKTEQLNELTAWDLVYKAVCDSNYHAKERYEELPDIIKTCIPSPAALKEMATEDIDKLNTVTKSNFMRTFRGVQERQKDIQAIPMDVKRGIEERQAKAIDTSKDFEQRKYDFDKLESETLGE